MSKWLLCLLVGAVFWGYATPSSDEEVRFDSSGSVESVEEIQELLDKFVTEKRKTLSEDDLTKLFGFGVKKGNYSLMDEVREEKCSRSPDECGEELHSLTEEHRNSRGCLACLIRRSSRSSQDEH